MDKARLPFIKILALGLFLGFSAHAESVSSFTMPVSAPAIKVASAALTGLAAPLADVARTIGLGREEYVYSVEWGVMSVGKATLGALETVNVNGEEAYHIVSTAKTLPFWDAFHKVRDQNEAWLSTKSFLSLGFNKTLREGKYYRSETVVFHHDKGKYTATIYKRSGESKVEEGSMRPYAYDVLSAVYWIRAQNLEVGKELVIDANTRKDWPLKVKVLREERVKVKAGEFQCYVVEPMMREEGIFVQKGKSMQIWMTKDSRKIPVQMKAEVFIGAVRAELEEIVYKD